MQRNVFFVRLRYDDVTMTKIAQEAGMTKGVTHLIGEWDVQVF